MINANTVRMPHEITDWVGKLEIAREKDKLLEVLRMIEPGIKDIFSASQNGVTQLYISNENDVVPIKYAGDGLLRVLYITSVVMANPGGLILIDEIENGLHYSMYSKLWEILSNVAKKAECQVIATTHSYEHVSKALIGVKDALNMSDFSIHRLQRNDNGSISDNVFDYEMSQTAVDSFLEVR